MPHSRAGAEQRFDDRAVLAALDSLLALVPDEPSSIDGLPPTQLRRLRERIGEVLEGLSALSAHLDSIRMPATILDPSDPQVIGRLIAETLLVQARHPLPSVARFYGSGVYALYYTGDFPAYAPIRGTDTAIYVGKADPALHGAVTVVEQGDRLSHRLGDHAKSIREVENLQIEDFGCRYLVVKSAWQNTAETYLIQRFRPVWNKQVGICYGFGKHGDDPGTRGNQRSPWDTIHPGRPWALRKGNRPNELTAEEILARIAGHFQDIPPEG